MNSRVKTANTIPVAFVAASVLACVCVISTASADQQLRSETVKFQDLDVNTQEGVKALYGRIHVAAWHVCLTTSSDPLYQIGARDCAKQAEAKAVQTVNLPQLTAFYRTKTGDRSQPLSASR